MVNDGKLRGPGTSLHTESLGALVVHRISPGAMLRLAQAHPGLEGADDLDPQAVADSILREVCRVQRVDGPAYSERELTLDEVRALAPAERLAIVRAVCDAEGWDAAGISADESLVRGVRAEATAEQERAVAKDIRDAVGAADGVLSPDTMARLERSAAQLEAVKASLQLPDWLDQMKARQRLYDPQPLAPGNPVLPSRPDLPLGEGAPMDAVRLLAAADLHSRKLDGLAEAQRLALQSQTDVNSAVLAVAQELSVRAKTSEQRANALYWGAVAAAALLAVAALAQINLSLRSLDVNERLQNSLESELKEQRDQLKALREQNDALREQGQIDSAALRELLRRSTPVAATPAPAAATAPSPPPGKGTKPATAGKRPQRAPREGAHPGPASAAGGT